MLRATLYIPQQEPDTLLADGLQLPDPVTGLAPLPERVAVLLNCAPKLVDVLANGPRYVVYSIFDCEGEVNYRAMTAIGELAGQAFDIDDEDSILRGAVLVVQDY